MSFAHFWAFFLESAETPLFAQINVFAIWALWLELKFTKPTLPQRELQNVLEELCRRLSRDTRQDRCHRVRHCIRTYFAILCWICLIYPKHLLSQIFPSKGKLGELSLRGKSVPLRDHIPSKIAFSFPQKCQFSQEMKLLRKRSF